MSNKDKKDEQIYNPDGVKLYMKEMGVIKLLDKEGERTLSRQIELSNYGILECLAEHPKSLNLLINEYKRVEKKQIKIIDIISNMMILKD
jgi:hypothetical protein